MDTQPDYPSPEHLARVPSSQREPIHVSSQGKEAASVTHDTLPRSLKRPRFIMKLEKQIYNIYNDHR